MGGFIYICGRDNRFRPILVVNVPRIVEAKLKLSNMEDLIIYIAEYIKEEIFVFGKIENWVLVVDLGQIGVLDLPFGLLKDLLATLGNNYRAKMFRLYVVNAPWSVTLLYSFINTFDKKTQKKILISKITCA